MKLRDAEEILRAAGIEDARDEARLIFSALAGIEPARLLFPDASAPDELVRDAIEKRSRRVPLAYVIGHAWFYREKYKVDERCLVPRSDTEILVDYAVKNLNDGSVFLDLCTGSGCIALSVLNNTKGTRAIAADISSGALELVRENAEALMLTDRISVISADVLSDAIADEVDAVLSNPPYVTTKEYECLEPEIYFEPRAAFVGGDDGGDFYRRLTELYKNKIKKGGFIAYEIGAGQAELLRNIASANGMRCEIIKDLGGRDRVAVLKPI